MSENSDRTCVAWDNLIMNDGDLVGKCFHSIVDDTVQWQGVVIGRPEPGWYLLQLFSWVMGEHSNQQLVRIEEMRGWLFYPDAEAMNYSYEYGAARRHRIDLRTKEAVPEKEKPAAAMSILSGRSAQVS